MCGAHSVDAGADVARLEPYPVLDMLHAREWASCSKAAGNRAMHLAVVVGMLQELRWLGEHGRTCCLRVAAVVGKSGGAVGPMDVLLAA